MSNAVTVLGVEHHPRCLVARYAHVLDETGGRGDPDGFPWCTCPRRRKCRMVVRAFLVAARWTHVE